MPIVSPIPFNPLVDGRQSQAAMLVRRGVQRLLIELGAVAIPELPLASGRRADLMALTRKGDIWIVEIKSSVEDFRTDRKWPEYRQFCDRLFFATHPDVPAAIFPAEAGFILSDGYGAEILRDAPEHRLAPATRKALTLRAARAGAARLTAAEMAGVSIPALEGEGE
ncbi:MAG: MmcB family DNA repair protein [Aquamicrobium sp.]|uniref:MmcB family DNA repair protein n=1 Tax=Aquamicrobium sp. TaxID=1872579 RepID=UPI00349EA4CE|nr:MmcB family DNA repair protein [Aquamicrobium sp.]